MNADVTRSSQRNSQRGRAHFLGEEVRVLSLRRLGLLGPARRKRLAIRLFNPRFAEYLGGHKRVRQCNALVWWLVDSVIGRTVQ